MNRRELLAISGALPFSNATAGYAAAAEPIFSS